MHEAMSEGQAIKRLPFIFAYQYEKKKPRVLPFRAIARRGRRMEGGARDSRRPWKGVNL